MRDDIKITSEEFFDNEKYILDDKDKERIEKNIEFLKKQNLPYIEYMRTVPINSVCDIKSKDDILKKLLVDFTMATFSIYSGESDINIINSVFSKLDKKLNIKKFLSDKDIILIDDIVNGNVTSKELNKLSWVLERIPVYLWVLGLMDKPSSNEECDINTVSKIIFKYSSYDEFLNKCNLRSKEDILAYADLISRLHYACRNLRMNDKEIPDYNENVIEEQEAALQWITSFDLNKLTKDNLKVECETPDIKFEFKIPFYLSFEDVKDNLNELIGLTSSDKKTRIVITDLGICDESDFSSRVSRFINMYNSIDFRVINKYELTSNFLSEKIKQVVIEKKINDVSVALNSYFMYIGNHIIKMDSIINNRTNYNNYNDLVNSFNSSIDMNIILSMKFVSYKSQKHEIVQNKKEEINNEYDYSDIFPNKENIYKIFSFCYSLYDKFNSLLERQDKHQIEKGKLCGYEIFIVDNSHENKVYSNFEDFKNEFENIKNISYITLVINLQYIKLNEEYNNEFRIIIKPYNIKFNRKSNHEQVVMNQIEDSINNVMSKLRAEDTIFKN